jgi:hypothetical protein
MRPINCKKHLWKSIKRVVVLVVKAINKFATTNHHQKRQEHKKRQNKN